MTVTLSTWHFASRAQTRDASSSLPLDADAWCDPATRLLAFDRLVHGAEDQLGPGFTLVVEGPRADAAAAQMALRYQRLFARRNAASDDARFDRLLLAHAALHDRAKPLVRADHDHALDVWQWVLRLAPEASEALQIAALLHDIERLDSETEQRIEQHAQDYRAFKERHARGSAERVNALLPGLGFDADVVARAAFLVARHEQPEADSELALLNDADALSFFALNSAGFFAYFGPEHTRRKVDYTLRRMRSAEAHAALRTVRLEPEISDAIRAHAQPT